MAHISFTERIQTIDEQFEIYSVSLIDQVLPGDFTGDGLVDAADYTAWRDGLGSEYDMDDYADWKNNFGAELDEWKCCCGNRSRTSILWYC